MQGDFSTLNFDPHRHDRGVNPAADGALRNVHGVLHQQGRVMTDADLSEANLLRMGWQAQAGRDIIGANVCAVPAEEPSGFHVVAAQVVGSEVRVAVEPGRAWLDGILARLAGAAAAPAAPVQRRATYLDGSAPPTAGQRDAVVLELSEEQLHAFQYPQSLVEPALGGVDTAERAFVNHRLRLLRLAEGEDCRSIAGRLRDDPSTKGRLSATLAPVLAVAGDCPVVGGGGYTGFEHNLYRIEIAQGNSGAPLRFKWSQQNAGLAARGRFDATVNPPRVYLDAGRASVVNSGLSEFYLEALQYDELSGAWEVVYGSQAALNTDHDLELATPATFGTLPATTSSVFFRLWNGIRLLSDFSNAVNPVELRDGIRLAFAAPTPGAYRPGDHWVFKLRAGEIGNPQVLVDNQPPVGIVYHRAPLAEVHWTAALNSSGTTLVEDCRRRFRPLSNQKICCTFLIGDGIGSFGDFNSLEEAAAHLPLAGGELCLLPGFHRANLRLQGRRNVKIHGCARRTLVLPRTESRALPVLQFVDCVGIEVLDLDLLSYDGMAIHIDGSAEGSCRELRIHHNRMIARTNVIRATNAAELQISDNRLHLLDTVNGGATISVNADDTLIERNTLVLLPFIDTTPNDPDTPDDNPDRDPADPCARPQVLYLFPLKVQAYAYAAWGTVLALLVPPQPYRAIGGIHVRAGSERLRILENTVIGGAGNGICLGGDIDPAPPVTEEPPVVAAQVNVASSGQFLALVQNEQGQPVADADVYLDDEQASNTDRSDAQGLVSVKAAPGRYTLGVAPQYRVLRVAEARDEGVLVNAITVAPRAATAEVDRGYMHQITIEANNISMMGLSGIGFALRRGAALKATAVALPAGDPKGALLAYIDALLLNFALTPLLRATHFVRDLVVLNNRIHHNLRNPFTAQMRADAQVIGRGGISLGVVEEAALSGNHIADNGVQAIEPVCGIFIGYGNNLELTDNVLADNGALTEDYEENRQAGLRGGIYVRFAGALTNRLSQSSGKKPALRVHDNRVDSPAGRALTAFAFGPVSVANNHLNSERTGRFGFTDTAFGGVLLGNLGGVHRLLARLVGGKLGDTKAYRARAEAGLPGGETLFNDNYVRLDQANRSMISQAIVCLDDLSYANNTASVYRADPFFINAVLLADTLRATGSRLREDSTQTLSMLGVAFRANITVLNQADHCILALPASSSTHQPRTIDDGNHIFDATFCRQAVAAPNAIGNFAQAPLAANASQLGGTVNTQAVTSAEVNQLSQRYTVNSLQQVNTTQVSMTRAYQTEALRQQAKVGASHPTTQAFSAQADASARLQPLLASSAEAAAATRSEAPEGGAQVSGRVVNSKGQGVAGYAVELMNAAGARVKALGSSDANGAFGASLSAEEVKAQTTVGALALRVLDAKGSVVLAPKDPVNLVPGADLQFTLTLALRIVPVSAVNNGTVIYGTRPPTVGTAPVPTPVPVPVPTPVPVPVPTPTPVPVPVPTPVPVPVPTPVPTPSPQPPKVRTPLSQLDIDAATTATLVKGNIVDVEGVVEANADDLAKLLGDAALAKTLQARAKRILAAQPAAPTQATRTPLDGLKLDATTLRQLAAGGVRDVEGILESTAAALAAMLGSTAAATKLRNQAKAFLAAAPAPKPAPRGAKRKPRG